MSAVALGSPILDSAVRSPNFFNGRLLSAEDLTQEQQAGEVERLRLGRAAGDGVVRGLQVRQAPGVSSINQPVLTVQAGLAVNRGGQALVLETDIDVALSQPSQPSPATASTGFQACDPLAPGVYVAGEGVYLLVICPAATSEGRAPVSGLGSTSESCNQRSSVLGVAMRLLRIPLDATTLADTPRLRSRVARLCFGIDDPLRANLVASPFGRTVARLGRLDDADIGLTTCDVPLAVLHWAQGRGVQFVDMWSVRRRASPRAIFSSNWEMLLSDRRAAEAEAMFFQFQEHVSALSAGLGTDAVKARAIDSFTYLPPVGVLPIASSASPAGFDYTTFFTGQTFRAPAAIEGARLETLLRTALVYPPIQLRFTAAAPAPKAIWLYQVRENHTPASSGALARPPYLTFTTGDVPLQTESRFDVARYDYGYFG